MYVKVTAGATHSTMLFEAESPIHTGHGKGEYVDGTVRVQDAIGYGGHGVTRLHVLEIEPDQTEYERNHDLASFRFAWWDTSDHGTVGVVTTRNIFILNEAGDTIDKA